jgi:hypothetical protein
MRVLIAAFIVALVSVTSACGDDDEPTPDSGKAICERGCAATLAANCPNSPPDQASCVSTCQSYRTGRCKAEYLPFETCAEGKPITCSSIGIPVVAECMTEQNAFIACLSS